VPSPACLATDFSQLHMESLYLSILEETNANFGWARPKPALVSKRLVIYSDP
ncbi:hypothetical protein SK128_026555, partial [Halocaridina rubra]